MKAIISEAKNVRPRGGPASNPRKMASGGWGCEWPWHTFGFDAEAEDEMGDLTSLRDLNGGLAASDFCELLCQ